MTTAPASAATIFALSSAPGRAAIAVIRVSGPAAGAALDRLSSKRPVPRRAAFRRLRAPATGEPIDDALVLWLPGPGTETGEDMAEFHVHGGRAVVAATLEELGRIPGLRPAHAGEFTRRAFDNGRIDLTTAEGIADLVEAETSVQRRQALRLAGGEIGAVFEDWRRRIIEAQGLVEAGIDFSDEGDIAATTFADARAKAAALAAEIGRHLAEGRRGEILRDGFRVTIAGPPNVGKSSLLNALARRDAAIVSEEAGTTRDVIEVQLDLGGYPVILIDTAGLREAESRVEQEGIRRTLARTRSADLVLWMSEATRRVAPSPDELGADPERILEVASKMDLLPRGTAPSSFGGEGDGGAALAISTATGQGLGELVDVLEARAGSAMGAGDAIITSARHRHEVEAAHDALARFRLLDDSRMELAAEELRLAATAIGRLAGRIDAEQVLDQVFARFCIGK